MTDNVLQFRKRSPAPDDDIAPPGRQWAHGEAFCIACAHTWVNVELTGSVDLECPNCGSMKGRWRFAFRPTADQLVHTCDCGNQLFYLTPDGHMCANCGLYQQYA